MLLKYNSIEQNYISVVNSLQVKNKEIETGKLLLEKGRKLPVDILQLKAELKALEYEKTQLIVQSAEIQFIIQNCIEGQTI